MNRIVGMLRGICGILSCGWWGLVAAPSIAAAQHLGPENVLVVVNSEDPSSLLVANHYQHLRGIPARNIVYLTNVPREQVTTLPEFRDQILRPIIQEIERRGLEQQIDCIAYSAGFPSAVMINQLREVFLKDHLAREPISEEKVFYPRASINSLTFYADSVLADDSRLLSFRANHYYQQPANPAVASPFDRQSHWNEGRSAPSSETGGRYYLSTVLATTWGYSNSEQEAIHQLKLSVAADFSRPSGVFYFTSTKDVRSRTRVPNFQIAIDQLQQMGLKAEVVETHLPQRASIAGCMIGIANYEWSSANNTIQPGAICDNLTSFGGMLAEPSQTKLTDFLRYGAAGSSGTVVEPFALQVKFPHPLLHVYYAQGYTLAEAFYLSVQAPLQLLIVGDPLCRPWAASPQLHVDGLDDPHQVSGKLQLRLRAGEDSPPIRVVEAYVDDRPVGPKQLEDVLPFDSQKLADGYHELRLVAVAADAAAATRSLVIPLVVNNQGGRFSAECVRPQVALGKSIEIDVQSDVPGEWTARHNGRDLAHANGTAAKLTIDSARLGRGPCRILCAFRSESGESRMAPPIEVQITGSLLKDPTRLSDEKPPKAKAKPAKK